MSRCVSCLGPTNVILSAWLQVFRANAGPADLPRRLPAGRLQAEGWDIQKNRELDAQSTLGPRYYYYNSHRSGGDYPWMKDNLSEAKGSPSATEIDAKWTFGGSWNRERGAPFVHSVESGADAIHLTFNELVTVKGKPRLRLANGAIADYLGGSGTNTLRFAPRAGAPRMLDFTTGTIIASEAITRPEQASARLPG